MDAANLIVVMIETPRAIANIDEIAAVGRIDVLLIGGSDLTLEMGIPGQFNEPAFTDAVALVVKAAQRNDRFAGLGGVYMPEALAGFFPMGIQLVLSGSDVNLLLAGAQERARLLRELSSIGAAGFGKGAPTA